MSVRMSRMIGGAAATAVIASTFGLGAGPLTASAATATTTFTCSGIAGDTAGSIAGAPKSSQDLLNLLASLGSSPVLTLPVTVESNAPATVSTGTGGFAAAFDYKIALPDSLIGQVKTLLGVNTIKVKDASFAIGVSGSATQTLSATTPQIDVSLASTPVVITQTVSGTVTPTGAGLIYYRPGSARLSIEVNGSVAGQANVGTLTVECSASGLLGSTAVRPPGSPLVTRNPITLTAAAGETVSVNLNDGATIVPDEGNPILWDSLNITNQATAGQASLSNGVLSYTAPNANGTYDVSYAVCGAARVIEGAPGVDEVQTIEFADKAYEGTRPLWFTLKFNGEETAPIVTGFYNDLFGNPVPKVWWDDSDLLAHILWGYFRAPSAAQVQAALEALNSIQPGDITVTGGPHTGNLNTPYTVTFSGALGQADVAQIEIGQWNTWLPNDGLAQILTAAKGLTGGGDAGKPAPPTGDESWNQFLAGAISLEQFFTQVGDRITYEIMASIDIQAILDFVTSLFPKTPLTKTPVAGEAAIAPSDTGPLCSQGVVQVIVTGAAQVAGVSTVANSTTAAGAPRAAARVTYAG